MRVQCPVCQAEYSVAIANAENSSAVRCGQCGLMFTPKPEYSGGVGVGKSAMAPVPRRRMASAPPPPTVIYTNSGALRSNPASPDLNHDSPPGLYGEPIAGLATGTPSGEPVVDPGTLVG